MLIKHQTLKGPDGDIETQVDLAANEYVLNYKGRTGRCNVFGIFELLENHHSIFEMTKNSADADSGPSQPPLQ